MMHALFICGTHHLNGGWEDMICTGSLEECRDFADRVIKSYGHEAWGHIVDLERARVTQKFHTDALYSHRMGGVITPPSVIAWVDVVHLELEGIK